MEGFHPGDRGSSGAHQAGRGGGGDGGDQQGGGGGKGGAEGLSQQIFSEMVKSFASGKPPDFSKAMETLGQELGKDLYGGQK